MWHRLARFTALYVPLAAGLGLLLGSFNIPRYSRFAGEGRAADGTVTATDCANHATFAYRFEAGGRVYTGHGKSGGTNPPCDRLRPGDRVEVWYLPPDPA